MTAPHQPEQLFELTPRAADVHTSLAAALHRRSELTAVC